MAKKWRQRLTSNARRIQDILLNEDYYIARWPNSKGEINLYLARRGDPPYDGVYISKAEN